MNSCMKRITRREAIRDLAAVTGGTYAAGCASVQKTKSVERPNVLFVLTDDQHFRALGAAGNPEVRTPNIDRLAKDGTYFTRCHVSNPICTPSRAAMLTGQYGFHNGVTFFGQTINPGTPTIGPLLMQQGYRTGYVGKWHNDHRPTHYGFEYMRNVFLGGMHDYESIPVVQGSRDRPQEIYRNPTEVFTDGALDLLEGPLQDPFALFLCYTAPHDPRTPPPEYEALYPPEQVTLPPNFMPMPRFDTGTLGIRDERLLERPLDPLEVRREIGRYYAMITHIDDQLGRVFRFLDQSGRLRNTVIVFAGDNGLTLGAHGLLGKQTMYEEGIRVPLIIRGPGIRTGHRCHALVDLMDIMPTMCDFTGADIPPEVDGMSLEPFTAGRETKERESIFCHYEDLFRMVKTDRYKLILHLRTDREEMFDLYSDPLELRDLSRSRRHQAIQGKLRRLLADWRKKAGEKRS